MLLLEYNTKYFKVFVVLSFVDVLHTIGLNLNPHQVLLAARKFNEKHPLSKLPLKVYCEYI